MFLKFPKSKDSHSKMHFINSRFCHVCHFVVSCTDFRNGSVLDNGSGKPSSPLDPAGQEETPGPQDDALRVSKDSEPKCKQKKYDNFPATHTAPDRLIRVEIRQL